MILELCAFQTFASIPPSHNTKLTRLGLQRRQNTPGKGPVIVPGGRGQNSVLDVRYPYELQKLWETSWPDPALQISRQSVLVYRLKTKQDDNRSPSADSKERRAYVLHDLADLGVRPSAGADDDTSILTRAKELTPTTRRIGLSSPISNKENSLSLWLIPPLCRPRTIQDQAGTGPSQQTPSSPINPPVHE